MNDKYKFFVEATIRLLCFRNLHIEGEGFGKERK